MVCGSKTSRENMAADRSRCRPIRNITMSRSCQGIRMPWQDRDMVMFLIGRHLDLSAAMFSRDVFDPQTIRDVAHQMGTVERLKVLTLLTYADISAVNPTTMTALISA